MKLLVAADSLLYKTPDGKYWCKTIYGYDFWTRYLNVFDEVIVVSRTKATAPDEVEGYLRVDGLNVRIVDLPYMRGMKQYILNYLSFSKAAKKATENADCAIIRLPSVAADMVLKYFKKTGKPYAIEVVADPFDAYASNKLAQYMYTQRLKKETIDANGVSYVTKYYLQSKYPSYSRIYGETASYFESYFSTINLPDTYFSGPKVYDEKGKSFTIIHTANSINNDLKGHETLIKVLKKLREKNYDVKIVFIGDGSKREFYEKLAMENGMGEYVYFTGLLSSSDKVREILLKGDIFVFPTKAEGLPRAIIEAMAVGLPVLSTPVNGIPELLDKEFMIEPNDVDGFVNKLIELFEDVSKLEEMSKFNIQKARQYSIDKLSHRRDIFYSKLRAIIENS